LENWSIGYIEKLEGIDLLSLSLNPSLQYSIIPILQDKPWSEMAVGTLYAKFSYPWQKLSKLGFLEVISRIYGFNRIVPSLHPQQLAWVLQKGRK
jgi:hypothetical protein